MQRRRPRITAKLQRLEFNTGNISDPKGEQNGGEMSVDVQVHITRAGRGDACTDKADMSRNKGSQSRPAQGNHMHGHE